MPCLESVTIGDDIWDENWLPLRAKMGEEGDASHSSHGGKKPYLSCKEMPEKVRSLRKKKWITTEKKSKCKLTCWHLKKAIHSSIQNDLSEDNSKKCTVFFKVSHGRKGDRMKQGQINHGLIVPFYPFNHDFCFIIGIWSGH